LRRREGFHHSTNRVVERFIRCSNDVGGALHNRRRSIRKSGGHGLFWLAVLALRLLIPAMRLLIVASRLSSVLRFLHLLLRLFSRFTSLLVTGCRGVLWRRVNRLLPIRRLLTKLYVDNLLTWLQVELLTLLQMVHLLTWLQVMHRLYVLDWLAHRQILDWLTHRGSTRRLWKMQYRLRLMRRRLGQTREPGRCRRACRRRT